MVFTSVFAEFLLCAPTERTSDCPLMTASALHRSSFEQPLKALLTSSPHPAVKTSVALGRLNRSHKVIRATLLAILLGCTSQRSVQVLGFDDRPAYPAEPPDPLAARQASILPQDSFRHLLLANTSPYRARRERSYTSDPLGQAGCAYVQRFMPGAETTKPPEGGFVLQASLKKPQRLSCPSCRNARNRSWLLRYSLQRHRSRNECL